VSGKATDLSVLFPLLLYLTTRQRDLWSLGGQELLYVYLIRVTVSLVYAASANLTVYFQPIASGSGIPESKVRPGSISYRRAAMLTRADFALCVGIVTREDLTTCVAIACDAVASRARRS
jgi:H+/Cl- antiporter ClcA